MLLSLITITRDDPAGLSATLLSAARLRHQPEMEQIVIDGGGGETIAAAAIPPVRHIAQAPHGIADAFNAGLSAATGEWVWFLNGGDRVDERLSCEFLLMLLRGTRASVIIGGTTYAGQTDPHPHLPPVRQWPPLRAWIPHPSTLMRRRLFEQLGSFDERYAIAMDYEWWLRALSASVPVDLLAMPFTVFEPGGISQQRDQWVKITRERDDAIRRHEYRLWQVWFSSGGRLIKAWLTARLARRIGSTPRKM